MANPLQNIGDVIDNNGGHELSEKVVKPLVGAPWGPGGSEAAAAVDNSDVGKTVNEATKAVNGEGWGKGGENVIPMKKELDQVGDAIGKLFS